MRIIVFCDYENKDDPEVYKDAAAVEAKWREHEWDKDDPVNFRLMMAALRQPSENGSFSTSTDWIGWVRIMMAEDFS